VPITAGQGARPNNKKVNTTISKTLSNSSFITVMLHNTKIRALIDTESHFSLLSEDTACKLKLSIDPLTEKRALFSANGSPLQICGQSTITLYISSLKVLIDVLIVKRLSETLSLSRSFLQQGSAVIDFANRPSVVTFKQSIETPMIHQIDKNASL
jgi:predicted aspartyl protease